VIAIPPLPAPSGPNQDGGTATILPRYEDVAQDGRMQLAPLLPGVGQAAWRALIARMPAMETFRAQGILPILRRLVVVAEDRPVSVSVPVHYEASYRFAREKNGDRLFLNMWVEARAPLASTLGPDPDAGAPRELVGRIFAEHVVTKPFAPPAERKVTRLEAPGVPEVPDDEHVFEPTEDLGLGAGAGAESLEPAGDAVFGLMHTDSNQHVNSLVYPRVFEEALVRRLVREGRRGAEGLVARAMEMRWRKPFFAGETANIGMRLVEAGDGAASGGGRFRVGAVGAFTSAKDGKLHSTIRVWMG